MSKQTRPDFSVKKGSDLSLSGPALVELLRAVLDKEAPVRFQARGFSMSPFIRNEDVVTIAPLQGKRPGLGRIIAFVHNETKGLCIHRIVRVKDGSYVTKGDNISQAAECVPREHVLGLLTTVERKGKKVFLGLGPERFLVAFLGGRGLLWPLVLPLWKVIRPFLRRQTE